ncbi:MAG: type IV secretory system conjugative DNA transfer family protein [Streptococcus sp.]
MFEELEEALPGNYACRQWELFNANFQAKQETQCCDVAQYSVFDHQAVTDMIKTDSMDIDTWNTQKTAVFIAIPETNKAFNFLASTFFAIMFEELTHGADAIIQGRREGYSYEDLLHVQFIIDEFANIGRIPNFNEVLASVRSREMSIKIILQAINQLKALYKDDWKTILNNCATLLYLGTNDEDTMKYFSMRAETNN